MHGRCAVLVCMLMPTIVGASGTRQPEALTLTQAVETALRNNAALAALRKSAEAAAASVARAGLPDPPIVEIAPNLAGSGGSEAEYSLNWPLDLGVRQRLRLAVARATARAARAEAESARMALVRDVRHAYWALYAAQSAAQASHAMLESMVSLEKAVRRQVDLGAAPASQVPRAEIESARARHALIAAEADRTSARVRLALLLGSPDADYRASDIARYRDLGPAIAAAAARRTARPEVETARARLDQMEAEARLDRAQLLPTTALQVRGDKLANGYIGLAAVATLPVVSRTSRRSALEFARLTREAGALDVIVAEQSARADVIEAVAEAQARAAVVGRSSADIVERSGRLAELVRKGYERGVMTLLDLLDAERTLRDVSSEHTAALAAWEQAIAQVEWACGLDLGELDKGARQ